MIETSEQNLSSTDPREQLLAAPMSRYQIIAIAVVIILCALDGFDVLAITFAAPALLVDWGIGRGELGYVLSAGLLGMAAGSLLIGPAADIFGRRKLIFFSLALMIIGTFWSAISNGMSAMIASRVLTGLGIGAMIATGIPMVAEYANAKRRDLAVSVLNVGYPIGGVAGGFLAAYLLPNFGWRAIFYFASALGCILLLLAWKLLPEPITSLIARPQSDSLARVNDYLKRCGVAQITTLPSPPPGAEATPVVSLFRSGMAWDTLKITAIYFLYVGTLFYMQSWVPALVTGAGFSASQGAMTSVCMNLGGICGGLFIGFASGRLGLKSTVIGALVVGALLTAVFGLFPADLTVLAITAGVAGFFLFGGMIGLYAVIARTFPAHIRATGTGFAIGIGRLGSVIAPIVAGLLFAGGMVRGEVSLVMAVPALLAAIILLTFRVRPPTAV